MPYSIEPKATAYVASGDLSSCVNRIVQRLAAADMKVGLATASFAVGVLQNAPKAGEHAAVITDGVALVRAGAALTAGQHVTAATSGWAVVVTSQGLGSEVLGIVDTGCASGMLAAVKIGVYYRANSVGN